jgi:hypothetical protein
MKDVRTVYSFALASILLNLKGQTNSSFAQGCQMVYFQTQNPNFGKF